MYPDLSYFLHDLIGTEYDNWTSIFKTFGLFLGAAFFASAVILFKELKRKEKQGLLHPVEKTVFIGKGVNWIEVGTNTLVGFFIGFKIPYIRSNFEAFKDDAASMVFSMDGNVITGIILALIFGGIYYYGGYKSKLPEPKKVIQKIYPHQRITDITFMAAIFGVLGARLFSIVENIEPFLKDPLGTLFAGSGLTIYGGLIVAFIAVYIYVKSKGIKPIHVMDAVAPALIVGYAVGRLGCHFSGDGDWGIVAAAQPSWWIFPDWAWSYHYPHNVADFYQNGPKIEGCVSKYCTYLDPEVYTTPIWEFVMSMVIFGILWALRKRVQIAGVIFFIYCILNGFERFFVETVRVNDRYDYFGLNWSQAQFIAVGLILIGAAAIAYLYRRDKTTSTN